ncbi:hypothetical protein [Liquorilactobacillus sucicola]|nr:hypothetical protein [Liquorilactobacillus sucicola]
MKNKLGFWAKLSLLITILQFTFVFLEKLHHYHKRRLSKKNS